MKKHSFTHHDLRNNSFSSDHQVASLLTIKTWIRNPDQFSLYFYEVCIREQTLIFHPTDYIDITYTQEQKRKAVYCHISQDPPGIYGCGHAALWRIFVEGSWV